MTVRVGRSVRVGGGNGTSASLWISCSSPCATWPRDSPLDLVSQQPVVFTVHGDSTDWTNNYATKLFTVQQSGGWFTKEPPTVSTQAGVDPVLALLIAHLCTREFSTSQIKSNFHPNFPHSPMGAVFGFF